MIEIIVKPAATFVTYVLGDLVCRVSPYWTAAFFVAGAILIYEYAIR